MDTKSNELDDGVEKDKKTPRKWIDKPLMGYQGLIESQYPNLAFLSPHTKITRRRVVLAILIIFVIVCFLGVVFRSSFGLDIVGNLASIFIALLIGLASIVYLITKKSKKESIDRIIDREIKSATERDIQDGLSEVYGTVERQEWAKDMACFSEATNCKSTKEGAEYEQSYIKADPSFLHFINIPISQVLCNVHQTDFYEMPGIAKSLLSGLVAERDQHVRMLKGPVNRPLIRLQSIKLENNGAAEDARITMELGACAFRDAFFTHYFPDYEIIKEQNPPFTLRQELGRVIEEYYKDQGCDVRSQFALYGCNDRLETFPLLPNHLGVTGIVELFNEDGRRWYVLQIKDDQDAADAMRLMWSFGAMIKMLPDLWDVNPDARKLYEKEFKREIVDKKEFGRKQEFQNIFAKQPECKLLGFVFNALYLYQPEIIVKIAYEVDDAEAKDLVSFENSSWMYCDVKEIGPEIFVVENGRIDSILREAIKRDGKIKGRKIMRPRRMFYFGKRFLEIEEQEVRDAKRGTIQSLVS